MVATAQDVAPPQIAPNASQTALAVKKKRNRTPGQNASYTWPLVKELAVRTMYLTQGMSPKQIAEGLMDDTARVSSLIQRRGWTKERRLNTEKQKDLALSRSKEQIERVIEATATLSEQAAVAGLQKAVEAATRPVELRDDAKNFRAWAGAARDLVTIQRLARRLDEAKNAAPTNLSINFFGVGTLPRVEKVDTTAKAVSTSETVNVAAREIK